MKLTLIERDPLIWANEQEEAVQVLESFGNLLAFEKIETEEISFGAATRFQDNSEGCFILYNEIDLEQFESGVQEFGDTGRVPTYLDDLEDDE